MKDNETDEQRSERLGKLREQFPWALRENPSDVVKLWTKREGKDGQKLTQQQQRELLGFGGEGPAANDYDSASSDEGGTGGSKRRRRQHHDDREAGGSDGCDDRDVKKMRGPDDDGVCRDASGGPQERGVEGGGLRMDIWMQKTALGWRALTIGGLGGSSSNSWGGVLRTIRGWVFMAKAAAALWR